MRFHHFFTRLAANTYTSLFELNNMPFLHNRFIYIDNKYYRGELVGGPVTKMNFQALGKSSNKNKGCLSVLLLLIISVISIALL